MHQIPRTPVACIAAALIALASIAALAAPGSPSSGSLDPSFGAGGVVTTRFPASAHAEAVALEPRGGIVLAGRSGSDLALARYRTDGSLDPAFGEGGRLVSDLRGRDGVAAAVQLDGKIVVAGSSGPHLALARYLPDGSLDPSFGEGGEVASNLGPRAEAIAL